MCPRSVISSLGRSLPGSSGAILDSPDAPALPAPFSPPESGSPRPPSRRCKGSRSRNQSDHCSPGPRLLTTSTDEAGHYREEVSNTFRRRDDRASATDWKKFQRALSGCAGRLCIGRWRTRSTSTTLAITAGKCTLRRLTSPVRASRPPRIADAGPVAASRRGRTGVVIGLGGAAPGCSVREEPRPRRFCGFGCSGGVQLKWEPKALMGPAEPSAKMEVSSGSSHRINSASKATV